MYRNVLIFLFLMALLAPTFADDAVEAAATSNIIFEKTPEIIMQDETLTITRGPSNFGQEKFSIDVDFHFKNISNHDITRKIAFVLPPVTCRLDVNSMWAGLDNAEVNQMSNQGLKDFNTTVNGQSQSYTTRNVAVLQQKDITNLLNQLKIPLNPCNIKVTNTGDPDPRYKANLIKYHLLTESNEAAWSENIYFEWMQVFPAGKTIHIEHHYTPIIGEAVPSPRPIDELNSWFTNDTPSQKPIWNRDLSTLMKTSPSIVYQKNDMFGNDTRTRFCVLPEWVRYHLTTGAYWNGGIGLFKLIINDNGSAPFAINQFYKSTDKVQRVINANNMTFIIQHFVPQQDLLILFLSLPKTPENFQSCGM